MRPDTMPDFPTWLGITAPYWQWTWKHQLYIYEKLRLVTDGECKRLMIFLPPRHAKSETVTVRYSAYRLECDPALNVILGSYNQKLANRFSRKIRRIAEERMPLAKDRKAVDEWETTKGGGVRAVGVGAGVTGFGAGLIMIDDPVKNRAEAESSTYRERMWDWFNDDVYTRLEPDGAIILIQTRWHEDDLAGRLIKEMKDGSEQWEIVNLPALSEPPASAGGTAPATKVTAKSKGTSGLESSTLAELNTCAIWPPAHAGGSDWRRPGEALWPERFDEAALEKIKRKLGSYSFAALYQQRPVPAEGGIFKRSWFTKIIDKAPEDLRWCRGYDLAVSTKTTADYTASFRCAKDKEGNLYIADGFRARIEFPEQRRYVIERMREERKTIHSIETAIHGRALVQDVRREAKLGNVALKGITVESDKLTRALAWAPLAEEGKLFLIRGPWNGEFIDEVCSFPNGRHDDQVDAVSLAVTMLADGGFKSIGV